MKKWNMTMRFSLYMDYEVEVENYNEAVRIAMNQAEDEKASGLICDSIDFAEISLHDYEELPDDYEFADGYYDNPDDDEEEEFEPGRPILDQMALNP